MSRDKQFSLEISYNLGVAYYEKAEYWAYDEAEKAFNEVIDGLEKDPDVQSKRELLALTHCGLVAIAAQRSTRQGADRNSLWEQGKTHHEKAVGLVSQDSEVYTQAQYSLALLHHFNREDFGEAGKRLRQVLASDPYHWRAYTLLGQIAMAEKQPKEAIKHLQKATDLAPEFEFAHYQLGNAYSMADKPDLAIEAYSQAPSIAGAHVKWGRVLAMQKEDYKGAIAQFERAIELSSQHADAHADLAWYLAEGDLLEDETNGDRAIEAAEMAVKLTNRNDWRKLGMLGRIYYACGRIEDAQRTLEETRQLEANAPHAYYYLARIDYDRGQYEQARKRLIAIFQLDKNGETYYWREKAGRLMREIKTKVQH